MYALSIQQPWASLIMEGAKTSENRTWCPKEAVIKPGDTFLIHCGKTAQFDKYLDKIKNVADQEEKDNVWKILLIPPMQDYLKENFPELWNWKSSDFPKGVILGTATFDSYDKEEKTVWDEQFKFHFRLSNVKYLKEPIEFSGKLNFFETGLNLEDLEFAE